MPRHGFTLSIPSPQFELVRQNSRLSDSGGDAIKPDMLHVSAVTRLGVALVGRATSGRLWSFHQGLPGLDVVDRYAPEEGADSKALAQYETDFASLIGNGEAVSFAAGRMAFFAFMSSQGIGPGDEVLLPGFTCAVMPNAVLRTGATPIYADISAATLGSDPDAIAEAITPRTRMVVAQHSFGYPCDISAIREVTSAHGVLLLEDCATTLGSTIGGRKVGTVGDAALFSTDHTKPLVTHVGGLLIAQNPVVTGEVRAIQRAAGTIPMDKQRAMWARMRTEALLASPRGQLRLFLRDLAQGAMGSSGMEEAFLTKDFSSQSDHEAYPYPARLPSFLARVGVAQAKAWPARAQRRREALVLLLNALVGTVAEGHLPEVLQRDDVDVVPLRLAWSQPNGEQIRRRLRTSVTTEATWFRLPVSVGTDPLETYGYRAGSCPVSERLGPGMVNIPVPDSVEQAQQLADFVAHRLAS